MATVLWSAFLVISVTTWVAYVFLWMVRLYYPLLSLLGVISVGLATWLVNTSDSGCSRVVLVAFVLILGQWWLVELTIVEVLWRLGGGFAP